MTFARGLNFPQLWLWIRYYKIWFHATDWNGGSTFPLRDDNFHQTTKVPSPKDCIFLPFLFPPKTAFSPHPCFSVITLIVQQLLIVSASHNDNWGFYRTVGIFSTFRKSKNVCSAIPVKRNLFYICVLVWSRYLDLKDVTKWGCGSSHNEYLRDVCFLVNSLIVFAVTPYICSKKYFIIQIMHSIIWIVGLLKTH